MPGATVSSTVFLLCLGMMRKAWVGTKLRGSVCTSSIQQTLWTRLQTRFPPSLGLRIAHITSVQFLALFPWLIDQHNARSILRKTKWVWIAGFQSGLVSIHAKLTCWRLCCHLWLIVVLSVQLFWTLSASDVLLQSYLLCWPVAVLTLVHSWYHNKDVFIAASCPNRATCQCRSRPAVCWQRDQ